MYKRQRAIRPHSQRLSSFPKLVVFSAPPDETLVHTSDSSIAVSGDSDAGSSLEVLRDRFWGLIQHVDLPVQDPLCMVLPEVEDEPFEVDYLPALPCALHQF